MININPQISQFSLIDHTIFELFSSALYDGVWYYEISQPENIVISKNLKTLLGYASHQKLLLETILHPEDLHKFQKHLKTITGDNDVGINENLRLLRKSGDSVWMQSQIYFTPQPDRVCTFIFIAFKCLPKKTTHLEPIPEPNSVHDFLEDGPIGTWQFNLRTGQSFFNESLAALLGYSKAELNTSAVDIWASLTHPEDFQRLQRLVDEHLDSNSNSFMGECRIKHKKGHWIWVTRLGKVTQYTNNNQPEVLEGILYNITDRKNSELQLQKYKDLLEGVNQAAEIGIWEVDLLTNKVYLSAEIKKIFGVSNAFDPTLDDVLSFYKEDESRQKVIDALQNGINKGQNYDIETEVVTAKGEVIWTRSIGVSEFKDGKCTRLFGFFQNINEKTMAIKNLAIKEELFRKTFSHAPVGMAIIDLNGSISQVNKNLCLCFGRTEKELLNSTFNNFSHPDDTDLTNDPLVQLLKGKNEYFKMDKRYIHKNGATIWTQISVSSVRNELGKIAHFVVQVQDITARKKDELLLVNFKDLLERSNYVAKIGSWEINIPDHTVTWSKSMHNILKTKHGFVPNFNESIDFFTSSAEEKELLKSSLNRGLMEGINFDIETLAKTYGTKRKWIRIIGISEFVDGKCQRLYGLIQDITDIKKAQLDIAMKEEQWRTTFNHAKAGMALINFNGRADNVNHSLCEIFGYSIQEMQEIGIEQISLSEDLEYNINLMNDLIHGRIDNFTDDFRFLKKNGDVIWANVSVSAVKNDYQEFTHIVAQVVDITESKTNQLLLKKSQESLDRSNKVAKIGSWEMDPITKKLYWNKNLRRLLGNTETTPRNFNEFITGFAQEKNQAQLSSLMQEALDNGIDFNIEIPLKTATGIRWMRLVGRSDFQDGTCRMVHGLIQDIDDFKKAQQEIVLREEEFRQTFWHAPIGMALLDLNGKMVKVNQIFCETFGYTAQEMIGKVENDISHPEDAELSSSLIEEVIDGVRASFQQEKRYFHKNGTLIWAILSISSVKNDQGEATHLVLHINNMTDKKLLTESLTEHNNRLQNYAHIVSHNLRSHSGNLSMLIELIEINNNRCNQELFEYIKSASNNMNQTVQHLTEIVEINNPVKDTLVPQNLKKSIHKSLKNVQPSLDQIHSEIINNINQDVVVYAVPSYLESIVLNLLTNAINYKSPDRILKIEINAGKTDGYTFLSISDNGLGIDLEKNGSKIFGMYKTFHEHRNARGLGLFISKNQIEAMGGRIEVRSTLNIGTTFTLYFKDEKN